MTSPKTDLVVFVATTREGVPAGCVEYVSVDGSVPGARVTWDHHVTGEAINLDAMPDYIDTTNLQGVGTTLADTDAVASVVAVMFGGKAVLPDTVRRVLESASFRCDHLKEHPDLDDRVNELGAGLHAYLATRLRRGGDAFSVVCRELAATIAARAPLPFDIRDRKQQREVLLELESRGKIYVVGRVGVVDLRGADRVDPEVLYERIDCAVAVVVENHADGGLRYTVGVNPWTTNAPRSLRGALEAVAGAEYAHGPPALRPVPGPGSENWGGRETVFGSPWNYGSRLRVEEVVELVAGWMGK
jgi:hypothetical protein